MSALTSLLNLLLIIKVILHDLVVQITYIIISLVTVHNAYWLVLEIILWDYSQP